MKSNLQSNRTNPAIDFSDQRIDEQIAEIEKSESFFSPKKTPTALENDSVFAFWSNSKAKSPDDSRVAESSSPNGDDSEDPFKRLIEDRKADTFLVEKMREAAKLHKTTLKGLEEYYVWWAMMTVSEMLDAGESSALDAIFS